MDMTDFMTRTSNILLGQDFSVDAFSECAGATAERFKALEKKSKSVLENIFNYSDFVSKYDIMAGASKEPGSPMIYVHTTMMSNYIYLMEAFPVTMGPKNEKASAPRKIEDLVYHPIFESVIEKFTKSNQKPNLLLRDTRSADFCSCLSIKVEAVPLQNARKSNNLVLLHEFLILHHLWDCYQKDMLANVCGADHMIGFPMPFEFANIIGSDYDFNDAIRDEIFYHDIHGKYEKISNATIPPELPESSVGISSSLSYFSYERLGPSLNYLIDLMQSQGKTLTLSSALKVYDQLICRLMVMHKYGVVHCDPNPTCIFFGPGETCNVIYLSDFSTAILEPEPGTLVPRFHDRFVSYLRCREKRCHYVHDIESAFYILIYMVLGKLPWDIRLASKSDSSESSQDPVTPMNPTNFPFTDRSLTTEDKEKFWQNPDIFSRVFRPSDLELHGPLYHNFSVDLIESLYSRTKESFAAVSSLHPKNYSKDVFVAGSQVYNIYFGLRRTIATYFRFESLSPSLKEPQGALKVDLLNKQSTSDQRIAWDLSHWCWNYLDPRQSQSRLGKALSVNTIAI